MAEQSIQEADHYALLIGINYYPKAKSLNGAVRDVEVMKLLMQNCQPHKKVQVTMLTASEPPETPKPPTEYQPCEQSNAPGEVKENHRLPTRGNIVASLGDITSTAKSGDYVYIHYSGHGSYKDYSFNLVIPKCESIKCNKCEGDECKAEGHKFKADECQVHKCDKCEATGCEAEERKCIADRCKVHKCDKCQTSVDISGSEYFRGTDFAKHLSEMVDKCLIPTVVLDCCYSGSVVRGGQNSLTVKSLPFDPAVEAASSHPPLAKSELHFIASPDRFKGRDAELKLKEWLVNPSGYTIFSACAPYEFAHEIELPSLNERRGALSYFLVKSLGDLRKVIPRITHGSLFNHLRTRFHVSWPQQNPMRYGNAKLSFFGPLVTPLEEHLVPIFTIENDGIHLDAGLAHGVQAGDKYEVYAFDSEEAVITGKAVKSSEVIVSKVNSLTSKVEAVKPNLFIKNTSTSGRTWKAKALKQHYAQKMLVRVVNRSISEDETAEMEQKPDSQIRFEHQGTGSCRYGVTINDEKEFEVLDAAGFAIPSLPTVPVESEGALNRLYNILEQIAIFKNFEAIENRAMSAAFSESFSFTTHPAPEASDNFSIKHNGTWELKLTNNSEKPLYFTIFNLTPSWRIINLGTASGIDYLAVAGTKESFPRERKTFPKKNEELIQLSFGVSDAMSKIGIDSCEDIIKVFVTNKPTTFRPIHMPELVRGKNTLRSDGFKDGDFMKFLSELNSSSGRYRDSFKEEWAAKTFIIHTSKK